MPEFATSASSALAFSHAQSDSEVADDGPCLRSSPPLTDHSKTVAPQLYDPADDVTGCAGEGTQETMLVDLTGEGHSPVSLDPPITDSFAISRCVGAGPLQANIQNGCHALAHTDDDSIQNFDLAQEDIRRERPSSPAPDPSLPWHSSSRFYHFSQNQLSHSRFDPSARPPVQLPASQPTFQTYGAPSTAQHVPFRPLDDKRDLVLCSASVNKPASSFQDILSGKIRQFDRQVQAAEVADDEAVNNSITRRPWNNDPDKSKKRARKKSSVSIEMTFDPTKKETKKYKQTHIVSGMGLVNEVSSSRGDQTSAEANNKIHDATEGDGNDGRKGSGTTAAGAYRSSKAKLKPSKKTKQSKQPESQGRDYQQSSAIKNCQSSKANTSKKASKKEKSPVKASKLPAKAVQAVDLFPTYKSFTFHCLSLLQQQYRSVWTHFQHFAECCLTAQTLVAGLVWDDGSTSFR